MFIAVLFIIAKTWKKPRCPCPSVDECINKLWYIQATEYYSGSNGKASAYNVEDWGSTPGLGRYPGEGNGNPLQYSCLESPMDGGAW